MNIKKFLITACLMLQFSRAIYSVPISAIFYNNTGYDDISVTAEVNKNQISERVIICFTNAAPYNSGVITINASPSTPITYTVKITDQTPATITATNNQNPYGYEVNTDYKTKTVLIKPLAEPYATTNYGAKFYNDTSDTIHVQALMNNINILDLTKGSPRGSQGTTVDIPFTGGTDPSTFNSGRICVTAFSGSNTNESVTYKVTIDGTPADPIYIAANPATPLAAWQLNTAKINGKRTIVPTQLDASYAPPAPIVYSTFFYNSRNQYNLWIQPFINKVYTDPSIEVAKKGVATVNITAFPGDNVMYEIFIDKLHGLNNNFLQVPLNDPTDTTKTANPIGYRIGFMYPYVKCYPLATIPTLPIVTAASDTTSYNSRSLGRMSSKKVTKKNKRSWSHKTL